MGTFIDHIKSRFNQKDILIQIIGVNVAVFLFLSILNIISVLFKLEFFNLLDYVGVSSHIRTLITRPWTVFTYMVMHLNFLHILFNMLLFYWFGQIFLSYFPAKNLGSLYILGGLAGAALYVLAFNSIPYYVEMNHPVMIGASASVTAVIFAAAFYRPNYEIGLLFLGRVKIIYFAIFIFILDFISLGDSSNPGGHVAHIGGAIIGYVYAKRYLRGKDITRWMTRMIDSIVNLFKPKPAPKMKAKFKSRETDYDFNQRKNKETETIDRILDKIKSSGYNSLSDDEKKQLFDASKK